MNNFNSNYYQWCREQASREANTGFPSVAAVRGSSAIHCVRALVGLPQDTRNRLASALVDRWHRQELDPEQQRLLAAFDSARVSEMQQPLAPPRQHADRKKLRSMLRESAQMFGKETEAGSPSEMEFEYHFDTCKVITLVDFGGRSRQMEYHQLLWVQGEPRPVRKSLNLMSWLGLDSVTQWDLLEYGEEEDAVRLLGQLCRRFLEAVPRLV